MKAIGFILASIIALIIFTIGTITSSLAFDNIQATVFTQILSFIVWSFSGMLGLIIGEKFYEWFKSKLK